MSRRPPLPDLRHLDEDIPGHRDDPDDDEFDPDDDPPGEYDPDGYDRNGAFDGFQVTSDAEGGL